MTKSGSKNRQRYPEAIEALQIALRTDVDDQLSWLRLGEAYLKAGRFAAALKALVRARELNPEDWICSYFIGEVQRQTGLLNDAISAFKKILVSQPEELKVLMSLGQTYLDLGCHELTSAFTTRAEESFTICIQVASRLMNASAGFRHMAWKMVGDALFQLSQLQAFSDEQRISTVLREVASRFQLVGEHISGIISLQVIRDSSVDRLSLSVLEVSVASYDYRVSLGSSDNAVGASSQYDLGIALTLLARRLGDDPKRQQAEESAVHCFKEAISLDYANDVYWNTLGNSLCVSKPKSAQHAYVKALEIDSKVCPA